MAFPILGTPKPQFFDSSGSPLASGTLEIVEPADDTNKATYPTYDDAEAATNANANPLTLDSRGEPSSGLWGLDGEDYKITVKDSSGTTIWTTDDVFVPTQSWHNQQTAAESTAGVTPTDVSYPPGNVKRYGATGDGSTDDTTAIANALLVGDAGNLFVTVPEGTYLTDPIDIQSSNNNVPAGIIGYGATLQARASSASPLISLTNPHTDQPGFLLRGLILNANDLHANCLKVSGSQQCRYQDLICRKATGTAVDLAGSSGQGIYYNIFSNIRVGNSANINGGNGFDIKATGGSYFIASNTFIGCEAQYCKGHGYDLDFSNNTYLGCSAERNDTYGWNIDNSFSNTFCGGYSEHNHENWATNGSSDATDDESFNLSANSTGVKVLGGRHIGNTIGTVTGQGNMFLPDNFTQFTPINTNTSGDITVNGINVRSGGGLGIDGATEVAGSINTTANNGLYVAGASILLVNATDIRAIKPIRVEDTNARIYAGSGTPEGSQSAVVGSIYMRTDGGASTSFYVKESGSDATGWVAK